MNTEGFVDAWESGRRDFSGETMRLGSRSDRLTHPQRKMLRVADLRSFDRRLPDTIDGGNFDNADLNDAILGGIEFRNTTFRGANLSGANLGECLFSEVSFDGADLRGARFVRAEVAEKFLRVGHWQQPDRVRPISFRNVRGGELGPNFFRAVLVGADMSDGNFHNSMMDRANLRRANLAGAVLTRTGFRGTEVDGAILDGADLSGACFYPRDIARARSRKGLIVSKSAAGRFMMAGMDVGGLVWRSS